MHEIYREILNETPLTQDEIDSLYNEENISPSLKQKLNELKSIKTEKHNEYITKKFLIALTEEAPSILQTIGDEITQLESKITNLEYLYKDKISQMLYATTGKKPFVKKYPSNNLRNKVFLGTVSLVNLYAKYYYFKYEYKFEFDELFQIAALSLLSATKYYVPNGKATFRTYASRCIETSLNKFVKKKKYQKRYVTEEKQQLNFINLFLDSLYNNEIEFSNYPNISSLNATIKQFNQEMLNLGYSNKLLKKIKFDDSSLDNMIKEFNQFLNASGLAILIDNTDREMVSLISKDKKIPKYMLKHWTLKQYIDLYLQRLDDINLYLKVEQRLRKDSIIPQNEDILKEMNQEVYNYNKIVYYYINNNEDIPTFLDVTNFYYEYLDYYNVDFLDGNGESRQYEIKEIRNEIKSHYKNLTKDEIEDLVKEELKKRATFISNKVREINDSIIEYNRSIELNKNIYFNKKYKRKYTISDIAKICENICKLTSENKLFLNSQKTYSFIPDLSLEEQAENNFFLKDYYSSLKDLPEDLKNIMLLWFDNEGKHNYSAKEISNFLNINEKQVYNKKDKALKLLSKNQTLRHYLDIE